MKRPLILAISSLIFYAGVLVYQLSQPAAEVEYALTIQASSAMATR